VESAAHQVKKSDGKGEEVDVLALASIKHSRYRDFIPWCWNSVQARNACVQLKLKSSNRWVHPGMHTMGSWQATVSIFLLLLVHLFLFPAAAVQAVNTAESLYSHLFLVIASLEELEDVKPLESLQCTWEFASYAAAYSKTHGCRLEMNMKPRNN
jgi:hypothetical protein